MAIRPHLRLFVRVFVGAAVRPPVGLRTRNNGTIAIVPYE